MTAKASKVRHTIELGNGLNLRTFVFSGKILLYLPMLTLNN